MGIILMQDMLETQKYRKRIRNSAPDPEAMERKINNL